MFEHPTVVPASDRTRHIWGDAASGTVLDRVHLSSQMLHVLEFAMPPGGRFGHSRDNPTIFAADELLYVLEGVLLLSDPSTGETQRASAGEAVFFRRDTWHHGRAAGDEGVRVLEFFSPTPATGASSAYGRTQPYLEHTESVDRRLLGSWPMAAGRLDHRLKPVREHDLAWATLGPLEVGFFAATEHMTVLRCHLRAGAESPAEQHPGGTGISSSLVIGGRLWAGHRGEAIALGEFGVDPDLVLLPAAALTVEEQASGRAIGEAADAAARIAGDPREAARHRASIEARAGRIVATALSNAVQLLDPAAVILGGGLGTSDGKFSESLTRHYRELTGRRPHPPPLMRAKLGPHAGVIGAGLLALEGRSTDLLGA
ncbi:MAG: ROK family protein [Acidimicrobiaceae bacterium]|nr:ROK family protein [Acidimicrobiaceae bacterium]